jgi:hypothetical protein
MKTCQKEIGLTVLVIVVIDILFYMVFPNGLNIVIG